MPVGELHEVVARPCVARVGDRRPARRDPKAGVRDRVRQQSRFDRERADRKRLAGLEFVNLAGALQGLDLIERQHRAQGIRQGVGRQSRRLIVLHQASAEQRVQIGDVVRVAVADEHGVDRLGRHDPEEPRDDRVARVDEQAEPVVLDEVATAGTSGRRKPAGAAEDGESHRWRLLLEPVIAAPSSAPRGPDQGRAVTSDPGVVGRGTNVAAGFRPIADPRLVPARDPRPGCSPLERARSSTTTSTSSLRRIRPQPVRTGEHSEPRDPVEVDPVRVAPLRVAQRTPDLRRDRDVPQRAAGGSHCEIDQRHDTSVAEHDILRE